MGVSASAGCSGDMFLNFLFTIAGPTSFAPIIEMAMTIVEQSGGQYHVLLIIADGQVNSRSSWTKQLKLSCGSFTRSCHSFRNESFLLF